MSWQEQTVWTFLGALLIGIGRLFRRSLDQEPPS